MVRRGGKALPHLVCELLHRALSLRKHVDDLGPAATSKRRRHRCERVEQGRLRDPLTHKLKLSFEVAEVNAAPLSGQPWPPASSPSPAWPIAQPPLSDAILSS